jgi:glutamate racemase
MKNNAPIGIFDSGLGGLTVAAAVKELMPEENIIYLGDTARVPYGDKSPETVLRFGCENAEFLAEKGVKIIIVACNTVSALAIDGIRKKFRENNIKIPLIGVLEAGVNAITQQNINKIAVIGTRGTITSNAYTREIHKKSPQTEVTAIACPLFAPIVEEGLYDHKIAEYAIDIYLNQLKKTPPDALLLGCTHYPLLKKTLKKYFNDTVQIIDSAHSVANLAENFLNQNSMKNNSTGNNSDKFYVTDSPENFAEHTENFLNKSIKTVEKVIIDKKR